MRTSDCLEQTASVGKQEQQSTKRDFCCDGKIANKGFCFAATPDLSLFPGANAPRNASIIGFIRSKLLTVIILPFLPIVIPEFLNPEAAATSCCRRNGLKLDTIGVKCSFATCWRQFAMLNSCAMKCRGRYRHNVQGEPELLRVLHWWEIWSFSATWVSTWTEPHILTHQKSGVFQAAALDVKDKRLKLQVSICCRFMESFCLKQSSGLSVLGVTRALVRVKGTQAAELTITKTPLCYVWLLLIATEFPSEKSLSVRLTSWHKSVESWVVYSHLHPFFLASWCCWMITKNLVRSEQKTNGLREATMYRKRRKNHSFRLFLSCGRVAHCLAEIQPQSADSKFVMRDFHWVGQQWFGCGYLLQRKGSCLAEIQPRIRDLRYSLCGQMVYLFENNSSSRTRTCGKKSVWTVDKIHQVHNRCVNTSFPAQVFWRQSPSFLLKE